MSLYAVADEHDQPLENLVPLDPQPKCEGIQGTETYGLDGHQSRNFLFAELEYTPGITHTQFLGIMAQIGVTSTVRSNEVTVYLRNEDNEWKRYNGIIHYPTTKRSFKREFRLTKDVTVRITKLVEIV